MANMGIKVLYPTQELEIPPILSGRCLSKAIIYPIIAAIAKMLQNIMQSAKSSPKLNFPLFPIYVILLAVSKLTLGQTNGSKATVTIYKGEKGKNMKQFKFTLVQLSIKQTKRKATKEWAITQKAPSAVVFANEKTKEKIE